LKEAVVRFAGLFLLLAGWCIIIAALVLFPPALSRHMFVVAGLGVQVFGLILAFRAEHGWKSKLQ
jgi:hypothetical protein